MSYLKNIIREAYERSLRNTGMSYSVYIDGESGKPYIYETLAGTDNQPEGAWAGRDKSICSFCSQAWRPEDGDPLFEENLLEYAELTKKEKSEARTALKNEELDRNGLIEKYPDAYKSYREDMIRDMAEALNPEDYIGNGRNGGAKREDLEEDRMR